MELEATIRDGVAVPDEGCSLPEGTRVRLIADDAATPGPSRAPLNGTAAMLLKYAGVTDSLPEDMARNHDHYLHGRPKK